MPNSWNRWKNKMTASQFFNGMLSKKNSIQIGLACFLTALLFSSCATLSKYPGVGRIKRYEIASEQVPPEFDGFRLAFASDFHYPSKYKEKHLNNTIRALQSLSPDVLLLGGDYQSSCEYDEPLFQALSQVNAPYGKFAVMGNHDNGCRSFILEAMEKYNIKLLEHETDTIDKQGEHILVCGIRNPFDLKNNGVSPTLTLNPNDFVIMLTHAPDYAEDADISNTDLVLAGHTHGGQVTFFYLYTPFKRSKYGFLTGKKENSKGIPVIVTNGLGTSHKKIRFCAPSEVVLITLRNKATTLLDD